ncbi:MAG: hypothetical protein Q9162_001955 [Coniocarpon cinnabarinum]
MAEEPNQTAAPTSKDSANQSAALTNLSDSHAADPSATGGHDSADTAKLGAALSGLSVADKEKTDKKDAAEKQAAAAPAKKVKVLPEDVSYLVEELEITKPVATGMLRRAEGKREKAIEDFVLSKPVPA